MYLISCDLCSEACKNDGSLCGFQNSDSPADALLEEAQKSASVLSVREELSKTQGKSELKFYFFTRKCQIIT